MRLRRRIVKAPKLSAKDAIAYKKMIGKLKKSRKSFKKSAGTESFMADLDKQLAKFEENVRLEKLSGELGD